MKNNLVSLIFCIMLLTISLVPNISANDTNIINKKSDEILEKKINLIDEPLSSDTPGWTYLHLPF